MTDQSEERGLPYSPDCFRGDSVNSRITKLVML